MAHSRLTCPSCFEQKDLRESRFQGPDHIQLLFGRHPYRCLTCRRRFYSRLRPTDYFEQRRPFGDEVYSKFPEARADIEDARNCAVDFLHTATVFHLMRVTEYGLRRLAKKLKATTLFRGKSTPVAFADWDQIITVIRSRIIIAQGLPRGAGTEAKLEAYSNAVDHCQHMKDIWRKDTARARRPYSETEAHRVLIRVRTFMQFLGNAL